MMTTRLAIATLVAARVGAENSLEQWSHQIELVHAPVTETIARIEVRLSKSNSVRGRG